LIFISIQKVICFHPSKIPQWWRKGRKEEEIEKILVGDGAMLNIVNIQNPMIIFLQQNQTVKLKWK
jgi:hypothetical protein